MWAPHFATRPHRQGNDPCMRRGCWVSLRTAVVPQAGNTHLGALRCNFHKAGTLCRAGRRDAKPLSRAAASLQDQGCELQSNLDKGIERQLIQWFPGHIARAQRQLQEQLGMVDVVFEVRDARIPLSTAHPDVPLWCKSKPRILIFLRGDMISSADRARWKSFYKGQGLTILWANGKTGEGVNNIRRVAVKMTANMNAKRTRRGLRPRPVRACVIGFPNIGKSALINRLCNRRVVQSAAKPGVTTSLQWVRLGGALDLLDSPGIIPMALDDQAGAQRLAMCDDIGQGAYVQSLVAAAFLRHLQRLPDRDALRAAVEDRYRLRFQGRTEEEYVVELGRILFAGDEEKAGQRILKDYRTLRLGRFSLETPDMAAPEHAKRPP